MFHPKKFKFNDKDIQKIVDFNKNYKNVEFICADAGDIIGLYKNNSRCFMFLDPPFLMSSNYYYNSSIDYFILLLREINNISAFILAVCGQHPLMLSYYEHHNLKIKFTTNVRFLGSKTVSQNMYVSNY